MLVLLFLGFLASESCPRLRYKQGLDGMKQLKNDGMKRVLLLAVVSDGDEKYAALITLVDDLKIADDMVDIVCLDLKESNILLGLMNHSSGRSCPYCHWKRTTRCTDSDLRTFEGMRQFYDAWVADGSKPDSRNKYFCCHRPTASIFPETGVVLFIFAPPELHLMLGIVNKLVDRLEQLQPDIACSYFHVFNFV